tara:strand:- start:1947 stop:3308 length:1362 start_codon:yes stop_codon:yes gene_type:complete
MKTRISILLFLGILSNTFAQDLQDWGKYENIKNAAVARIDTHRKGTIKVKIVLPNQKLATNTQVRVKLKRHEFKFGAVVSQSFSNSPYREIHRENFLKYFNASGFGLALKPKREGSKQEELAANITMPWFKENDIYVRGHNLTWEGNKFFSAENLEIFNDKSLSDKEKGDKLVASSIKHFHHVIPKWDVQCWDVSNEPIANNDINKLLPDLNTHAYWFKLADSLRTIYSKKHVKLYQNDYQIISAITPSALSFKKKGYKAIGRPALYREMLDEQIALGAPIEGIGFQSRLKGGMIAPDSIYKRLCDFDRFNLSYQATEFEVKDNEKTYMYSDEEQKLLTEYMMVMYLSHPKVTGFWHWTFADMRPKQVLDYPLFNYDGTPKPTGVKWIELMEGFFDTDVTLTTDENGAVSFRGYYGAYEIMGSSKGKQLTGVFELESAQKTSVEIAVILKKDK